MSPHSGSGAKPQPPNVAAFSDVQIKVKIKQFPGFFIGVLQMNTVGVLQLLNF